MVLRDTWPTRLGVTAVATLAAAGLLHLVMPLLPGDLATFLNEEIRKSAPGWAKGLRIEYACAAVVGLATLGFSGQIVAFLSHLLAGFGEAVFRPIGRPKAFDPLRGPLPAAQDETSAQMPLPFDRSRVAPNASGPRAVVWSTLAAFAEPHPDAARLRRGGHSDFIWTVLTGRSGLGKSRLALEFARHLARRDEFGGDRPAASVARRLHVRIRTALRLSQVHHPWDAGWLESLSTNTVGPSMRSRLDPGRLKAWVPRKPTFLILDEPLSGDARRVIDILGERARTKAYGFPVRLLIVSPTIPKELELDIRDGRWSTETGAFRGQLIELTENAAFDVDDIKAIARDPDFAPWLPGAILERSPVRWGDGQYTASIRKILDDVDGNPFLVEQALLELRSGAADQPLGREDLLGTRAARMVSALEVAGLSADGLALVAAATLAGGVDRLGIPERERLFALFPKNGLAGTDPGLIDRIMPVGMRDDESDLWLPVIRPRLMATAFVRDVIARRKQDREATARRIVSAAWATSPKDVLRAVVDDRFKAGSDLLGRLLAEGPPASAELARADLLDAYLSVALLVPRATWDRGRVERTDGVMDDLKRLIEKLSPEEAWESGRRIGELASVDRSEAVVLGHRGLGLLGSLADRLIALGVEADRAEEAFWHIYRIAAVISDRWSLPIGDVEVAQLSLSLHRLGGRADRARFVAQAKSEVWRLVNRDGYDSPLVYFLVAVTSSPASPDPDRGADPSADDLDLLEYLTRRLRSRYASLVNGLGQKPVDPRATARLLASAEEAADDGFDILLRIAGFCALPDEHVAAAVDRLKGLVAAGERGGQNTGALVSFAYRAAVLDGRAVARGLAPEDWPIPAPSLGITGQAALWEAITMWFNRPDQPDGFSAARALAEIETLLENRGCPVDAYELIFLAMIRCINCDMDVDRIEGAAYQQRWDRAVALAKASAERWIGHVSAEVSFAGLLCSRSRAYRDSPVHTRATAYEIEDRLGPFGTSPGLLAVMIDGWRLHAYALANHPDDDAVAEMEDLVEYVDGVVGPWSRYTAVNEPHALCHEYRVRLQGRLGQALEGSVRRQALAVAPEGLTRRSAHCLLGSLRLLANSAADDLSSRQAAIWHLRLNQILAGASPPQGFALVGQDAGNARDLHLAMVPVLRRLIAIEERLAPDRARIVAQHLERTVVLAGLPVDETAHASDYTPSLKKPAKDLADREPPSSSRVGVATASLGSLTSVRMEAYGAP